jgi:aminopeptidase
LPSPPRRPRIGAAARSGANKERTVIEPTIDPRDLETWAAFLLEHSLGGISPEDRVMIKGERICWPLVAVLERRIVEAGGIPDVYLVPPNNDRGRVWSATMGRCATPPQFERVPAWHGERYASMTKYIEVLGAEDPQQYAGLDAQQVRALATADRPFATVRLAKPWVLTLYPTPGFAAMEGMALDEYTRFIVKASTTDPRVLRTAEEALQPHFQRAKTMTIETHCPHEDRALTLRLSVEAGLVTMSYGLRNFPDGELFTSPDARTPEGEIFIDLPVHYNGCDIQGIYLKLEGGRITRYSAVEGEEHLRAIIETDAGSHRLGEVALGMNPGLDRVLKHPLFVEKVGGTLHIALGASYENCFVADPAAPEGQAKIAALEAAGVLNRSAQHVDIVADFRPGGCGRRVLLDDKPLAVRDGVWVMP